MGVAANPNLDQNLVGRGYFTTQDSVTPAGIQSLFEGKYSKLHYLKFNITDLNTTYGTTPTTIVDHIYNKFGQRLTINIPTDTLFITGIEDSNQVTLMQTTENLKEYLYVIATNKIFLYELFDSSLGAIYYLFNHGIKHGVVTSLYEKSEDMAYLKSNFNELETLINTDSIFNYNFVVKGKTIQKVYLYNITQYNINRAILNVFKDTAATYMQDVMKIVNLYDSMDSLSDAINNIMISVNNGEILTYKEYLVAYVATLKTTLGIVPIPPAT